MSADQRTAKPASTEIELILAVVDGKVTVTSLELSRTFGKRHDNVIRDMESVFLNHSAEFSALNFEESDFTDSRGKRQKMYTMTRDGFLIMAMGFTGPTAAKFKEAFIAEFNRLEQALQESRIESITSKSKDQQIKPTTWPTLNKAYVQYLRFVCGQDDRQIEAHGHVLHLYIKSFHLKALTETGNKILQDAFIKTLTASLIEAGLNGQFANKTAAENYQQIMTLIADHGKTEMARIGPALILIKQAGI